MSSRPIRFFHRGGIVEVRPSASTRTLLEWLREDAHCSGTKEGCAEGDCGACTVVVGEPAAQAASPSLPVVDGLALRSVNACIQFLPTLDGKALFTVEDLKAQAGGRLHPVQQALVECHGSQCGFCTSGFVMSLWSTYEQHRSQGSRPNRQQLADELSGNLCRCTGYRPILDAGERMFDLPAVELDTGPVLAALQELASRADARAPIACGEGRFHAPRTLDALAALRAERPVATLLAGSTDIGLWVTKQFRALPELIHLGEVPELKRIEARDGVLEIGAGVSLEDAWGALAARWPTLTDVWLRFASLPIRHAGTLGGNIANGSPIGDGPPVLMVLGASIVLRHHGQERELPLADFYLDYMKNRLEPGEFVRALRVPLPVEDGTQVRAWKISKRFDCDISALCAGLALRLEGDTVAAARLCFGGMAATVRHARHAEAALIGQPWTEANLRAAQQALAQDFSPLSDMRASADYRLEVARNLLRRLWLETRVQDPLPPDETTVWTVMQHAPALAHR